MVTAFDAEAELFQQGLMQFFNLARWEFSRIATFFADKEPGVVLMAGVITTNECIEAADTVDDAQLEQEVQGTVYRRRCRVEALFG